MPGSLAGILEPRSIAVVGATESPARFGGRVLRNVIAGGFGGPIYPVNPKYESVQGLTCYPTLSAIPGEVDAAIFAIPAPLIAAEMAECGQKGVRLAVLLSSGFAEVGPAGRRLQDELVEAARQAGVRLLGPNGLGFMNVSKGIVATTITTLPLESMTAGPVSLVTQSGALGYPAIFSRAHDHGVHFRLVVAGGNEADLSSADVIRYYTEDEGTEVIAAMVEGVKDPAGFREALDAAFEAGRPVVVLKVGRSEDGRRAVGSHTASMAGSDAVNDAIFEHHGVIRVDDLDELWKVPTALTSTPLPNGRRLALVSSSGGLGGLFADHVRAQGLELAGFSAGTREELKRLLPDFAVVGNPLDITGAFVGGPDEATLFQKVIGILTGDPGVDILVIGQVITGTAVGAALVEAVRNAPKTTVILSIGGSREATGLNRPGSAGIPIFDTPESCARTLRYLCERAEANWWRDELRPRPRAGAARTLGPGVADHDTAVDLLTDYGLPLVRQRIVDNAREAVEAADWVGYPVAVKAILPGTLHKTELNAVILDVRDAAAMRGAAEALVERVPGARILVQRMAGPGVEMIVGIQRDPQFGPVVLVGAGGVLVEVLDDKLILVPPFSSAYVRHRIPELKVYRLLGGVRGAGPADLDGLADLVVKVGDLALDQRDHLESLDLNPVIVLPAGKGCSVVDWALTGLRSGPLSDRAGADIIASQHTC